MSQPLPSSGFIPALGMAWRGMWNLTAAMAAASVVAVAAEAREEPLETESS